MKTKTKSEQRNLGANVRQNKPRQDNRNKSSRLEDYEEDESVWDAPESGTRR